MTLFLVASGHLLDPKLAGPTAVKCKADLGVKKVAHLHLDGSCTKTELGEAVLLVLADNK